MALGGEQIVDSAGLQLLARAEGIAVGQGSRDVLPHHVLLSVLYERASSLIAIQVIERLGCSRQRLVDELGRLGVSIPSAPLPALRTWGTSRRITRPEFERLATELQSTGIPYCFARKGDEVVVSIATGVSGRIS